MHTMTVIMEKVILPRNAISLPKKRQYWVGRCMVNIVRKNKKFAFLFNASSCVVFVDMMYTVNILCYLQIWTTSTLIWQNVVIGLKMKKDILVWVLVETYVIRPLNWNSCSHWSKCDNSLKVYNNLDDKSL
jgi:hypothetical protein